MYSYLVFVRDFEVCRVGINNIYAVHVGGFLREGVRDAALESALRYYRRRHSRMVVQVHFYVYLAKGSRKK